MINKQILIIELNEQNFNVLESVLSKNGYVCKAVLDLEAFQALELKADAYDLIIVNSHVQYVTVADVMKIAESETSLKVPVIYIDSAKEHSKSTLDDCFAAGVSDYIKKPFDSKEIVSRVNYHCEQLYKLREYKLRLDKLANLATIDQLSKSTSKMHMQAILRHQINYFNRYKTDTTLIYLSLLNIDKLIGTFGLEKGERVIAQFAKVLKSSIRESDVLARWAGSDFIILLTNTSVSASEYITKKLKAELSNVEVMKGIKPELAFGITSFTEDDDVKEVIERAKYALSEAKKQTYGKIHIAD
ncbi:GGDEF domain-containing response regulator [Sulfurimonas paralvinellae]|uniref:diguanylate cyclase n=1 Tax=Sulfurimonas paralvinellae TaxID=317658 RepID=A0A7M1B7F1_9BACT|nr:diguanylate cyclase [Sulfurimonas paralvinellae]QOP45610.1 diguanylate cyclase [Sulfurimonas paralvinellae]